MYIIINDKKCKVKVCNSFFSKLKGFMFKKNINEIICLTKCNSIHTFFMFDQIDVVMTDKKLNILHIYKNLKPWKIILPKKHVYYTFEFPKNKYNFSKKLNIKEES